MTGWQARQLVLAAFVFAATTATLLFAASGLLLAGAGYVISGALVGAAIATFLVAVMFGALWMKETLVHEPRDERRCGPHGTGPG